MLHALCNLRICNIRFILLGDARVALDYWVEFFDDLQNVRGRSRNTVLAYRHDLELYDQYKSSHQNLDAIFDYLNRQKLSQRSQARFISSLRTYFKFCERHGDRIPELDFLRPPKVTQKLPQPVRTEDFFKMLEVCVTEDLHKTSRNQLTLLFLFGVGLRVTELINLKVSDYSATESMVVVLGKGGKERMVPLPEQLNAHLQKYLKDHRSYLIKKPCPSILLNEKGNQPSRIDIWRWLQAWSAAAGFEETLHPHRFRHGCATVLLENGADLRTIQLLLGHTTIQTTQIYTSVSTKHLKDAVDESHPFTNLDIELPSSET